MRDIWALVQVAPCPSGSKVIVTFGFCCLYLSLIWAIAFLNASALEPEFQAITWIVTGPPPPLVAGAAAAGAEVGWEAAAGAAGFAASAGFCSAGLAGALVAAGEVDWPQAARTTAPAPRANVPRRRRRLKYMTNLLRFSMIAGVTAPHRGCGSRRGSWHRAGSRPLLVQSM